MNRPCCAAATLTLALGVLITVVLVHAREHPIGRTVALFGPDDDVVVILVIAVIPIMAAIEVANSVRKRFAS